MTEALGEKLPYDCIVLDLDGTLVYSSKKSKGPSQKIKYRDVHGDIVKFWVHKRPGFDEFLQQCFEKSKVGVWSMGQPEYVKAIVSLFPQTPIFVYSWWECDRAGGKIFKRLNNIPHVGNIIMIDDKTDILETCNRINTHIVSEWNPHQNHDTELYDLLHILF